MNYTPWVIDYLTDRGYGHVTGFITDKDIDAFRNIVERMPRHFRIVELGSLFGASAVTFALLANEMGKTCEILCIDHFIMPGQLDTFKQNITDFSNITYRAEIFDSSFQYDGGPIDLYFDDASHIKTPTYNQLVYWSQYAKNIAVHDYIEGWEGTIMAVDRFAVERELNLEKFVESSAVYMENVR
jgi:predicted O-methyltransferase YrrM